MLKELRKDLNYLYVNQKLVSKHTNQIKLMMDDDTIYEGNILDDLVFELKKFKIGAFVRLYVKVDGQYLFIDKEIINYDIIRLSKEKINAYLNDFLKELREFLDDN